MSGCHPSYTAQECKIFCENNPAACSRQVPEPGTFVLLAIAAAVWTILQLRRFK